MTDIVYFPYSVGMSIATVAMPPFWRSNEALLLEGLVMVYCCCVIGCHNRRGRERGVSFHRIPAVINNQGEKWRKLSLRRRSRWITAIKWEHWTPNKLTRLCLKHFASGKSADMSDTDNPDWIPHLHIGYETTLPNQARQHRLED